MISLHVNDLPNCIVKGEAIMYADDMVVLFAGKGINQLEIDMNSDLMNIAKWFDDNRLTLNVAKTKYIVFSSLGNKSNTSITLKLRTDEIQKVET